MAIAIGPQKLAVAAPRAATPPSTGERLQAELVADPAALAEVRDRWRALAEGVGNPFVTPDWHELWLEAAQESFEPFVIAVFGPSAELCGVLPLVRSADRRRELRLPWGDYFELLAAPGAVETIAEAVTACLRSLRRHWRRMTLDHVDPEAAWVRALVGRGSPLRATTLATHGLPFVDLDGITWESYLAGRSSNLRGELRRKERALERNHEVRFRRTTEESELAADFDTFLQLHRRRRGQRGSSLDNPRLEAMLRAFAGRALERGWLRLWILEVDATPVAASYGWRLGPRYLDYQGGFDPDWARANVGWILTAHTLRSAIDEGAAVFDLLLGRERFKQRLATGERDASDLMITGPADPLRARAAGRRALRRLARAVRQAGGDPLTGALLAQPARL